MEKPNAEVPERVDNNDCGCVPFDFSKVYMQAAVMGSCQIKLSKCWRCQRITVEMVKSLRDKADGELEAD